jgi:glyoxylase-like metal-dependent hydrolase (beta-lactamase superfamily II)
MQRARVELLAVGSTRHYGSLVGLAEKGVVALPALVALIRHPVAGPLLFDAGYGSAVVQANSLALALYRSLLPVSLTEAERLDRQLAARGVAPPDLALIFLSHVHPDHIGGLADLPPRPLLSSRAARGAFDRGSPLGRLGEATLSALRPGPRWSDWAAVEDRPRIDVASRLPGFDAGFDLFSDGSLIAIPLPGHARGQTGLLCRLEDGRELFLVADAAWVAGNITEGLEPKRILDLIALDRRALHLTLGRLRRLHRERPDIIIVPSHCARSLAAFQRA